MEIIKVEKFYSVKGSSGFIGGKFDTKESAQYAVDNLPEYLFETVWISVLGGGGTSISLQDVKNILSAE